MASTSLAHPAHSIVPEETPETRASGTCASCGTSTKTLTAPRPNVGHGYTGPMYCLPCNPRFGGTCLTRNGPPWRGWAANRLPLIAMLVEVAFRRDVRAQLEARKRK